MGVYEGGGTGSLNTHTTQIISGGKKMAGAKKTTSGAKKVAPVKIATPAASRSSKKVAKPAQAAKMRGSKVSGGNFGQNND
jgi:hypothetical protein